MKLDDSEPWLAYGKHWRWLQIVVCVLGFSLPKFDLVSREAG
jgi:hypothetical protein